MSTKYQCIVADPAWSFGDKLGSRGAKANYVDMSVDEICGLARWRGSEPLDDKIPPFIAMCGKRFAVADDCLLFLWRVASMPREALQVLDAWGFEPKSEITWVKVSSYEHAKTAKDQIVKVPTLHFGMGRYVRNCHETCLIAARGKASQLIENHSTRSVFFASTPRDKHGKIIHSAKPPEFYTIVENLCGGPRLELFAREGRAGWTSAGNEIGVLKN